MKSSLPPFPFHLNLGDWSSDGHGQVDTYTLTSRKPIEDVREAYHKAVELLPQAIHPHNITSEYEDCSFPADLVHEIESAGYVGTIHVDGWNSEDNPLDGWDLHDKRLWLADYTAWFINQGDQEIQAALMPSPSPPMLHFYGFDKKGRHIPFIGYGLFSV